MPAARGSPATGTGTPGRGENAELGDETGGHRDAGQGDEHKGEHGSEKGRPGAQPAQDRIELSPPLVAATTATTAKLATSTMVYATR